MGQTVHSSAGENHAAIWDFNLASGELPSCSVQSAAVREFIYQGVKDSWKKEYWPPFSSGRFVAENAMSGFSACRSPAMRTTAGPQLPAKRVCQSGYELLRRGELASPLWPSHSFDSDGAVPCADGRVFRTHGSGNKP
jgi:hypothetical protein